MSQERIKINQNANYKKILMHKSNIDLRRVPC